ncbi:zinc transporter ZIP1-like [Amphiura filiformis]|uniref:zinc transporter ZIP1-like n=1 Tax=Amphiura filiformis TaxID=82378 RepID=UPI003B21890B
MEELTSIKIIGIFVLLFIALAFGVLPIVFIARSQLFQNLERKDRIHRVIACLNSFAGGVFMGIALIHLLPEVRDLIKKAIEEKGNTYNFNWAELCVACGFFTIVFVEQLVHICQEKLNDGLSEEETPFASHGNEFIYTDDIKNGDVKTSSTDEGDQNDLMDARGDHLKKRRSSAVSSTGVVSNLAESTCSHTHHTIEELAFDNGHLTASRATMLLISLSLHSIFEGLALGLQLEKNGLTDIFIAISLHKGIEAFTIAVGFAQISATLTLKYISTIFFAFMSPIGIAIGIPIALSSENDTGDGSSATGTLVNGVLQGLATGTFMFVTFIEILPHELNSRKDPLIKFFFIILGFSAITLLNALE